MKPLRKDQVVNLALDPRTHNLGSVGAALVTAAKAAGAKGA